MAHIHWKHVHQWMFEFVVQSMSNDQMTSINEEEWCYWLYLKVFGKSNIEIIFFPPFISILWHFNTLCLFFRREVSRILTTTIARVASISPEFFSAKLIAYFTFLAYILTGNVLTAEVVFVTISLYNPVRLVMMFFFPLAIQHGSELLVTIRRVQVSQRCLIKSL